MAPKHALTRLTQAFFAWKAVLLIVAVLSPGPGYDTSALIAANPSTLRHAEFKTWSQSDRLSLNLLRWDALYFVKSAQRGYLYEQEWAFSWAYSLIINTLVKRTNAQLCNHAELTVAVIPGDGTRSIQPYVWAGLLVSNICHFVSVLTLYYLTNLLLGHQQNGRAPFIASILHILSPAGMFLSAPYTESLFAALNFVGMLLYAQARVFERLDKKPTFREDYLILAAGIVFTLATWIRSNGLLSGLLFVFDAILYLSCLLRMQPSVNNIRRLAVTCVSGVLLGLGSVLPQYVAYQEYCTSEFSTNLRPWCHKMIPSIYTWVQSHYWNVGFLRYWTLSNLPLFLMAAPMLWLLISSSLEHFRCSIQRLLRSPHTHLRSERGPSKNLNTNFVHLPQLALPQLFLAITAATNFHVQVINRLSSGYPLWYLAVAKSIVAQNVNQEIEFGPRIRQCIFRGVIVYAMVQGALFANFLPPA